MQKNGFDGVDIDWEYPVADDRGGVPEDFDNFPKFMERLRKRLNASGKNYGLSITLVSFRRLSPSKNSSCRMMADPTNAAGILLVPSRL